MIRWLPLLALLTGCRSCAERREERMREELEEQLQVDALVVLAEQVEREDGGVEAWGESASSDFRPPEGWTFVLHAEEPAWAAEDCPDDVPLAMSVFAYDSTRSDPLSNDYGSDLKAHAGGCDAAGDDVRGEYSTGYTIDISAESDEGERLDFSLPVEVELTIE